MIHIDSYRKCPLDTDLISAFSLDIPGPDYNYSKQPFGFQGWVVSAQLVFEAIDIVVNDTDETRIPLSLSRPDVFQKYPDSVSGDVVGFFKYFNPLTLPIKFSIKVFARANNEIRIRLYDIEGNREALYDPCKMEISPLVLTTLGRTGSNITSAILGAHPEIVVYQAHRAEARYASYWVQMMLNLGNPQSWLCPLAADDRTEPNWVMGEWVEHPLNSVVYNDLCEWFNGDYMNRLYTFFLRQLQEHYQRVATIQKKKDVRLFCEKFLPDRFTAIFLDIIPSAREVFLIRDFRDTIASILAFNAKRGVQKFGRVNYHSDRDYIVHYVKPVIDSLVKAWKTRCNKLFLLKYEDLVLDPVRIVKRLFQFLEVDCSLKTVNRAVENAHQLNQKYQDAHRTTPTARSSIGRFRNQLSPSLIELCDDLFKEGLQIFDYKRQA
jgi:hypothetical protein